MSTRRTMLAGKPGGAMHRQDQSRADGQTRLLLRISVSKDGSLFCPAQLSKFHIVG